MIVPAYNEEAIITSSLETLTAYMSSLEDLYRWEMVVVNDGSGDRTGELAEEFARTRSNVRVLHHHVNFRLGQALRYAFSGSRGDYVVVIDCDLSYAPEHIGRLLYTIQDTRARIVIASPYMPGGRTTNIPFVRRLASRWANRMLAFAAGGDLSTVTGMVRVYDGRFLRGLNLKAMDTDINTEIIYKARVLRARIVEIPAHLDWSFQSTGGMRRAGGLKMRRSTVSSLFSAFIFRPFLFFILPGLLLLGASLYTGGWVVWHVVDQYGNKSQYGNYGLTGAIQNAWDQAPHTFFIFGISLLLSVQLLSLGIIATQSKRYFEELFHLGTSLLQRVKGIDPADHLEFDDDMTGTMTTGPVEHRANGTFADPSAQ
ncbi:MAG: glycosyltransferase family 2 protein [Actinobacteria bacterium]|nr:glycosyltransferase family 2 protein [Actinomycetota bacterium]